MLSSEFTHIQRYLSFIHAPIHICDKLQTEFALKPPWSSSPSNTSSPLITVYKSCLVTIIIIIVILTQHEFTPIFRARGANSFDFMCLVVCVFAYWNLWISFRFDWLYTLKNGPVPGWILYSHAHLCKRPPSLVGEWKTKRHFSGKKSWR